MQSIQLIEQLVDIAEAIGACEFGASSYPGELAMRRVKFNQVQRDLDAQLNSIRLLIHQGQNRVRDLHRR